MDQEHAQGCGVLWAGQEMSLPGFQGVENNSSAQGCPLCAQAEGVPGHQSSGSARTWHSWAPELQNNGTKQGTESKGNEIITGTFPHWISRKPGLLKAEFRTWNLQPHTFASLLWEQQMDFLQVLTIVN